jgi:poly-beta-hydroxyalkanoate depolymerase
VSAERIAKMVNDLRLGRYVRPRPDVQGENMLTAEEVLDDIAKIGQAMAATAVTSNFTEVIDASAMVTEVHEFVAKQPSRAHP